MVFFDNEPARDEVTKTARPGLLQLIRNHSPDHDESAAPSARMMTTIRSYVRP
jgi:hypothetical protein